MLIMADALTSTRVITSSRFSFLANDLRPSCTIAHISSAEGGFVEVAISSSSESSETIAGWSGSVSLPATCSSASCLLSRLKKVLFLVRGGSDRGFLENCYLDFLLRGSSCPLLPFQSFFLLAYLPSSTAGVRSFVVVSLVCFDSGKLGARQLMLIVFFFFPRVPLADDRPTTNRRRNRPKSPRMPIPGSSLGVHVDHEEFTVWWV